MPSHWIHVKSSADMAMGSLAMGSLPASGCSLPCTPPQLVESHMGCQLCPALLCAFQLRLALTDSAEASAGGASKSMAAVARIS